MASSTFVFVSSDSGADVVLFTCPVLLLSYHPYVTDRVVFTFRLTVFFFFCHGYSFMLVLSLVNIDERGNGIEVAQLVILDSDNF